ncbi:MAG: hypothetical protein ACLSVD_01785 [Eggerthellaceae bacterium]
MNYNVAGPRHGAAQGERGSDDLMSRDQRMMFATVTLVHFGDTPEELDGNTEARCFVRAAPGALSVLRFQQLTGCQPRCP